MTERKLVRTKLRAWRLSQGLSIDDMAALLKISHGTYFNWENLKVLPHASDIKRITALTNLTQKEIDTYGKREISSFKKRANRLRNKG